MDTQSRGISKDILELYTQSRGMSKDTLEVCAQSRGTSKDTLEVCTQSRSMSKDTQGCVQDVQQLSMYCEMLTWLNESSLQQIITNSSVHHELKRDTSTPPIHTHTKTQY